MDELYRFQQYPLGSNNNFNIDTISGFSDIHHQNENMINNQQQLILTGEVAETHTGGGPVEMSDVIKAQIASHPLYPNLLSAYIECRKVGAPPEMASLLEEISQENQTFSTCSEIGTDPQLDDFMRTYCEVLHKYKEEFSKPYDEATSFLSSIESQLTNLCKQTLPHTTTNSYSAAADDGRSLSDEDMSCGDLETPQSHESNCNHHGDHELKQMLMQKYSGYLSSLKKEFLKKRKKGKLPKDARTALLDWWNTHYRWPYPTEDEKNKLSEMTGLDQKQINNWFINQRKRHWRPSEDMRFALMEGVSGGIDSGSMYFDVTGGTG